MRIPVSLLTRFGVDEALLGDLIEQSNAGRSRAWLLRQVVGAIASALSRDLKAHPLRTAVAVLLALLLRDLTMRLWALYEPAIDLRLVPVLPDVVWPFGRHAWIVALGWTNSIMLVPAWLVIGFVLARLSHAAVPIFVALAVALLLPGMNRQLHIEMWSDVPRWLLPVQLTIFATSIVTFAVSTLVGAVGGLRQRQSDRSEPAMPGI